MSELYQLLENKFIKFLNKNNNFEFYEVFLIKEWNYESFYGYIIKLIFLL